MNLVLVVNAGSSSLKYQLLNMDDESVIAKGNCDRIGIGGHVSHKVPATGYSYDEDCNFPTHTEAFEKLVPYGKHKNQFSLYLYMTKSAKSYISFFIFRGISTFCIYQKFLFCSVLHMLQKWHFCLFFSLKKRRSDMLLLHFSVAQYLAFFDFLLKIISFRASLLIR